MDLKERARTLKTDIPAIFLSLKDKETPVIARVFAGITVAYALSPVDLIPENHMTELYFEEPDIEGFVKKLEESGFEIRYVNELMVHSWGQKVVRFYDPDGNLIEVGTPVS